MNLENTLQGAEQIIQEHLPDFDLDKLRDMHALYDKPEEELSDLGQAWMSDITPLNEQATLAGVLAYSVAKVAEKTKDKEAAEKLLDFLGKEEIVEQDGFAIALAINTRDHVAPLGDASLVKDYVALAEKDVPNSQMVGRSFVSEVSHMAHIPSVNDVYHFKALIDAGLDDKLYDKLSGMDISHVGKVAEIMRLAVMKDEDDVSTAAERAKAKIDLFTSENFSNLMSYGLGVERAHSILENSDEGTDEFVESIRKLSLINDGGDSIQNNIADVAVNLKDYKLAKSAADFILDYAPSPRKASALSNFFKEASQHKKESLVKKCIDYAVHNKHNTAFASNVANIAYHHGTTRSARMLSAYIRISNALEDGNFELPVYHEFAKYLADVHSDYRFRKKSPVTVEYHKDFLNEMSSDIVFPVAMVLNGLPKRYHEGIKGQDDYTLKTLALGYDIATKNFFDMDDENKGNYVTHFFNGLIDVLEDNPKNVGDWATAIVEGFTTSDSEGIMRKAA